MLLNLTYSQLVLLRVVMLERRVNYTRAIESAYRLKKPDIAKTLTNGAHEIDAIIQAINNALHGGV